MLSEGIAPMLFTSWRIQTSSLVIEASIESMRHLVSNLEFPKIIKASLGLKVLVRSNDLNLYADVEDCGFLALISYTPPKVDG